MTVQLEDGNTGAQRLRASGALWVSLMVACLVLQVTSLRNVHTIRAARPSKQSSTHHATLY